MSKVDNSWQSMAGLAARLGSVRLFAALDEPTRIRIATELEWFSLPGGAVLYTEGETPDAFFVVLSGLLGIVSGPLSERSESFVDVRPGECVGHVGMLSDKPHSGTAIALRDSTLGRIAKPVFERLVALYPVFMLNLATELVEWTFRPPSRALLRNARRTAALLPVGGEPPSRLAMPLKAALEKMGRSVAVLDVADHGKLEDEYDAIEFAHDMTLYCGETSASSWTHLCLRRADRVLFVADATATPQRPEIWATIERLPWRRIVLVLMQEATRPLPAPAAPWLRAVPAQFHRHCRRDGQRDVARLARYLIDGAIGLVLSGGGARAYGHIGVVQALNEAGIEFDLLGGTSMGAIVAAGIAYGWSNDELRERMLEAFVRSNPLHDLTLPILALTKGRQVSSRLRQHFGISRIEDLWLPFFTVSSNLTTGKVQIHQNGLVWRALRASVAIPGLLPPSIENGEVLVDGAVMNNLPAEVMSAVSHGPVIGVDVGRREDFRPVKRGWLAHLLLGEDAEAPSIATLLLRAGTIASEAQTQISRENVDLLIEPALDQIGMRDWKSFDRAIEAGYRHAAQMLANTDLSIFRN
ncbi:MAG TPA: patatin-like phospholipase family protein [Stellaceae bacterium]